MPLVWVFHSNFMYISNVKKRPTKGHRQHRTNQQVTLVSMETHSNKSLFFINTQQNCFCYSLPYSIAKTGYSDHLWVTALCLSVGLMPFVYTILQRKPWGYGVLVHIAPLFVCIAVSKDACGRFSVTWSFCLTSVSETWNWIYYREEGFCLPQLVE